MLKMQGHNQIKYHNWRKVHPEKNRFKVQNAIFRIFFKIAFFICFVKKYEPCFGIKRSRRPFWNKQKWLDKIVCFNFLQKRDCTQNQFQTQHIPFKIYVWSFLYHHHSQKCFTVFENAPGIYDEKKIFFPFFSVIAMLNITPCN